MYKAYTSSQVSKKAKERHVYLIFYTIFRNNPGLKL